MAIVRLGPGGEVEVIVPPTAEEAAEAEAAVLRLAGLLGRLAAERDWNDRLSKGAADDGLDPSLHAADGS